MKNEIFSNISNETIIRYNDRLDKHGKNIKTLGWGNVEQQEYRFNNILYASDFVQKNILDIGCGFGDLFDFLNKSKIDVSSYTGWDLNEKLLNNANNSKNNIVKYEVVDISNSDDKHYEKFDIGVMLGLLNYKLKSDNLNYDYSKNLIKNAFNTVREVLIVDFISTKVNPNYPKENFIFYHEPQIMLDFATQLTSNVVLRHNYEPIPQKEFMLYIYK